MVTVEWGHRWGSGPGRSSSLFPHGAPHGIFLLLNRSAYVWVGSFSSVVTQPSDLIAEDSPESVTPTPGTIRDNNLFLTVFTLTDSDVVIISLQMVHCHEG